MSEANGWIKQIYSASPEEYSQAVQKLVQEPREAATALALELKAKDRSQRQQIVGSLITLLGQPSDKIRLQAAADLIKIGTESRPFLDEALSNSDPETSILIRKILTEINYLWDNPELVHTSKKITIHPKAIDAAQIEIQEAIITLAHPVHELVSEDVLTIDRLLAFIDISVDKQYSALQTLFGLDERSLGELRPLLADPDPVIRRVIANIAARIGGCTATDLMLAALRDDDVFVREVAAGYLAECGAKQAAPALLDALISRYGKV